MRRSTAAAKSAAKKRTTVHTVSGKSGVRHSVSVKVGRRKHVLAAAPNNPVTFAQVPGAKRGTEILLRVIAGKSPFSTITGLSAMQRSEMVENGVPASLLKRLATALQVSQEKLYATIGVSRATVSRALKSNSALNSADSEHAMGLARLVGQVEQIVQESGNPAGFDAGPWVANFLDAQHASLGGRRPGELMRTSDGRAVIATLISQMQSGAYA